MSSSFNKLIRWLKSLNHAQFIFVVKSAFIIFLALILSLMLMITHHHEIVAYNNDQQTKRIAQVTGSKYVRQEERVQKKIINHSVNSTDPVLRAIGKNHQEISTIAKPLVTFSRVYYDFSNENQYRARVSKLRNVLSSRLLKSKQLFGSDNNQVSNNSINSVLSNLSVSKVSQRGSNVNLLVDTYYTTWQNASNASDSNSATRHDNSQWILATVNIKQHRITNLKLFYLNPNAHNNSNNDSNNTHTTGSGVIY